MAKSHLLKGVQKGDVSEMHRLSGDILNGDAESHLGFALNFSKAKMRTTRICALERR